MRIGVVYAESNQQIVLSIELPENSTVLEAIEHSGILSRCPQVNLKKQKVGIYGKIVKLTTSLSDGDRVEIYRPITVDPKTVPQRKLEMDDNDEED